MCATTRYWVTGNIDEQALRSFLDFVQDQLHDDCLQLDLFIQSEGGSVSIALAFAHLLAGLPCRVHTYNTSNVDSAAIVLFAMGQVRFCACHASFFLHPIGKKVSDVKTVPELRAIISEIEHDTLRVTQLLEQRTGTSASEWRSLMERNAIIGAMEAKTYHLVTAMDACDTLARSSVVS